MIKGLLVLKMELIGTQLKGNDMKNNDIAAFPLQHVTADANAKGFHIGQCGMTLRDYFAIHAPTEEITKWHPETDALNYYKTIIKQRYIYADKMLEERNK